MSLNELSEAALQFNSLRQTSKPLAAGHPDIMWFVLSEALMYAEEVKQIVTHSQEKVAETIQTDELIIHIISFKMTDFHQ